MYKYMLCVLLGMALWSCRPDTEPADRQQTFFDIEAYFQQQMDSLNEATTRLNKKVTIEEQTEEREFQDIDYTKELQIFKSSHINRPAWSDKYRVDSTMRSGELVALSYTALDTSLNTRLIDLQFGQGQVKRVQIRNKDKSMIAATEQNLLYIPGKNYRISSSQKTVGSAARRVLIEATFQ